MYQLVEQIGSVRILTYNDPDVHYITASTSEDLDPSTIYQHSAIYIPDPTVLLFPYLRNSLSRLTAVNRSLILGLGGGTAYHYLRHKFPNAHVVAVDNNKDMIEAASRYGPIICHQVDAYTYQDQPYDFVLLDVFPLTGNREHADIDHFMKLVSPDGFMAVNYWSPPVPPPNYYSIQLTDSTERNYVLLVSHSPLKESQ